MKSTNYTHNPNKRTVRKIYGIVGIIFTLTIPFFIMRFDNNIEDKQSFCPHKMLTGMPCPGCGITKSIVFFYKGDILKSLSYHVLGPFAVILGTLWIFVLIAEIITEREYFNNIFFSKKLAYVLGFSLAGYHLIRTVYFIGTHSLIEIIRESIWM